MDAERFDRFAAGIGSGAAASRRAALGGVLGGVMGMLAHGEAPARRRKRRKRRTCKSNQTRCQKTCVNTNTDEQHCGGCGNRCASGERCLHGSCFSDDTCPFAQEACPNFRRCGVEDSDCFCGTTTGGESVCFQDEDFCESPRPCQSNSDCEGGRVCVDTSLCCEVRDEPAQPRTCLLPCESPSASAALASGIEHKSKGRIAGGGPGASNH